MFYLVPLVIAVLLGTLRSRQPKVLMLWDLKAVFILPLALFAALLPFWLATYVPQLIWTQDRLLLMVLVGLSRGLFLLFALINLAPVLKAVNWREIREQIRSGHWINEIRMLPVKFKQALSPAMFGHKIKHLFEEIWSDIRHFDLKLARRLQVHPRRILAENEQLIPHPHANRLRLWGLMLAVLAFTGQLTVLLSNQGYWPLTPEYLDKIADPLFVEGILHGSLRLQRLIDDQTQWAWLGQILPWPDLDPQAPARIQYLSLTEPLLAASLFLTTLSLFPSRQPNLKRGKHR